MYFGRSTFIKTAALAAVVILAVLIAGCTGTANTDEQTKKITGDASLGQTNLLTITGSTTVLPIAQAAAEAYMATDSKVDIQVSGGGSSAGVLAVGEKTADIGMASREMKESEKTKYPSLVEHSVAKDGIAVIVSPKNTVTALSLDEIKQIYAGGITNWNQVGGNDMEIVVVGRDSSSGTREFFTEKVMGSTEYVKTQLEKNSNGAVAQTIAQTPGAIGYISLGYLDESVKGLMIKDNGRNIVPSIENVQNGSYPIARELFMLTNGDAKGLAKKYLDYLLSSEGQAIVQKEGYVTILGN